MPRDKANGGLKSAFSAYRRALQLLSHYVPGLIPTLLIHSVLLGVLPYVSMALLCRILETVTAVERETLWLTVGMALATEALLLLVCGLFRRWKEAKWEQLYHGVRRMLTDVVLDMDHATATSPETVMRLFRVREVTESLGLGIVRVPELMQNAVRGLVGVIGAVVMLWGAFFDQLAVWQGLAALLTAGITLGVVSCSAVRSSDSRVESDEVGEIVRLDRQYYALFDAAFDAQKAAYVRLYREDRMIARRLENTEQRFFEKQGLKYRRAHGARALAKALAASLATVWRGVMLSALACKAVLLHAAMPIVCGHALALMAVADDAFKCCWAVHHGKNNLRYLTQLYEFVDVSPRLYRGSLTTEKRNDRDYELRVCNVGYRYDGSERAALKNVSVTLGRGRRVAVVGENGSGKSTLIHLLARLYDPDQGVILLGGIDIRKYRFEEYGALISAVFQQPHLPMGSLGEIVAGSSVFDSDRVKRCLSAVGMMDMDVNASLGALSAGQTTCVALARALYKEAPILLLDEPMAALDPKTEAALYEHLDHILEDRAVVFVSHRLASCRFCDEILVLDDGEVVQHGTHDDLIRQKGGLYERLWRAQAQYYLE